jgi:hypothetical protein
MQQIWAERVCIYLIFSYNLLIFHTILAGMDIFTERLVNSITQNVDGGVTVTLDNGHTVDADHGGMLWAKEERGRS